MAAKHWIRDVFLLNQKDYIAGGNHLRQNAIFFHFLRTAGFEWLWECDGEVGPHAGSPNHVPDGNMEEATAGKWTAYGGATSSKQTTGASTGRQRLKVAATATGQGVTSDPLISMTAPRTPVTTDTGDYLAGPVRGVMQLFDDSQTFVVDDVNSRIVISGSPQSSNNGAFPIVDVGPVQYNQFIRNIYFYNPAGVPESYYSGTPPPDVNTINYTIQRRYEVAVIAANSGPTWNVRVDPGTGSFATVGTIPNNGGTATLYRFTFYVTGSGSCYLRFESTGAGDLYVDAANVHRSQFEAWKWAEGTDGIVANGDEFSTAGSFTADDEVVGKHLFLFDESNPENSGCYEILADVGGGSVRVDLRSQTFQFTPASSISWRIVQIYSIYESPMADWMESAGYGLESPHSSGWRFFLRQNQTEGQAVKNSQYWAAPEDTDFDFSSGNFWTYAGPSSQRNREGPWTRNVSGGGSTPNIHTWRGTYTYQTSDTRTQTFAMTDANRSFIHFIAIDSDGTGDEGFLVGYMRETPPSGFSAIETFAIWGAWQVTSANNRFYFDSQAIRIGRYGTVFRANELSVEGTILQHGLGTAASQAEDQATAGPNPFSGKEWLRPLIFGRDYDSNDGDPAYFNMDPIVYQGRANIAVRQPFGDDDSGTGDSITAGTPAYITDAAGDFTTAMIGRWVTIAGAPNANNNGVFKVTGVPDANTLQYTNPSAVTESAPAMTWDVSSFSYLHIRGGWVIPWSGEALAS